MIPKILQDVANYLIERDLSLNFTGQDARMDSSLSEQRVISFLQNAEQNSAEWRVRSPNLQRGNNRAWYDAQIGGLYVDIKISNCKTSDNTNAKKAIYYFLTGESPEGVSDQESVFFDMMRKNEKPDDERDYYYLVINKLDLKDIFVVSLKGLSHASPAPNNMPFQSNWGRCREPKNRNWSEAKDFLLATWAESVKKAMEKYKRGMMAHYPEFFNE